jgi:hypothetical protein
MEPFMRAADYASARRFRGKLATYMEAARAEGWLQPNTVVIWPEYLGAWLAAMGEKRTVYDANGVSRAMAGIVAANLPAFAAAWARSREPNRAQGAVFRMKARAVAEAVDDAFSSLARVYGVTMAAGSAILPEPYIEDGRLRAGVGPLQNVCAVYGPDGRALEIARKVFPTPEEAGFVNGGRVQDLTAIATPAGRLGLVICADSWSPEVYARLREERVDFVAVASFGGHGGIWNAPWKGYGTAPPPDVNPDDVGRLTEKAAWLKYALPGRIAAAGADRGLNVFFQGDMWGFRPEAQTLVVNRGAVSVRPAAPGRGAIVNLWL